MIINDIDKLNPISIRVPKKLRDDLLLSSNKNRRSLSSYCRIIIEDNYLSFGGSRRYDILRYKEKTFVPLSFTISNKLKDKIVLHINSFKRPYYNKVIFSEFIRKVLSDSKNE